MNRLKFLGRGSGYHLVEGNTSAYIKKDKTLLLIDCGETVFKRILEKELLQEVEETHVLITHMHSDHIGSLGGFIGYSYWKYNIVTNVYFNEKEKISMFLELIGLKEGENFKVHMADNIRIQSLEMEFSASITKHVKTLNTYSYSLQFDKGNNIYYSGDTYETNIDVLPYLKEGNIIYHDTCLNDSKENVHTSLRLLSEMVPKEYRNQVYCIHIDGENFIDEARKKGFNIVYIEKGDEFMEHRVDLHTHSNISDGACTPKELIDVALKENIKAIALTDHDNIGGIEEAYIAANEKNIDFLAGIEISSLYKNGRIIHILGLGIDFKNEKFLNAYNEMKIARDNGVEDIVSIIKSQGINIPIDDLRQKAKGKYLDRYDIYRYFIENKLCNSAQEIWDKYLDPIPYGEKELIKVEDAIRIIKAAGGQSFLAHYNKPIGFLGLSDEEIEEEIKYLISLGLDGVERYYPSFNEADYEFLDFLISKYNLMTSGGTDYHGKNRPYIKLGSGENNNLLIPYSVYIKIINKFKII